MGLLDDYSGPGGLLGIGMSPRPAFIHQILIQDLSNGFNQIFKQQGFRALTEVAIQKKPEKAPDVVFFRAEGPNWEPLVFIEITKTREAKAIITESKKLMKALNIQEAFIYDYETKVWHRLYDHERWPNTKPETDWCETFQIHLNSFLY